MRTPQGKLFFIIRRCFPAVIYRTPHCFLRNPSVRRLLQKPFQFPQLIRHIQNRFPVFLIRNIDIKARTFKFIL